MNNFNVLYKDGFSKVPVKCWHKGLPLEDQAKQQLLNLSSMPFVHDVCSMPDAHSGKGSCVGTVYSTTKAIIPASVGADIGCGMIAIKTSLMAHDLPDNLFNLRCEIERLVPHGRTNNGGDGDRGAWGNSAHATRASGITNLHFDMFGELYTEISDFIINKGYQKLTRPVANCINHLGTLGSGNHFIEICLDENQQVWIMVHSGSRGIGAALGNYFVEKAKEEMKQWYINLPDIDLAYLPDGSVYFGDYIFSVHWAQKFSKLNRNVMLFSVINAMRKIIDKEFSVDFDNGIVDCHHNYISFEKHYGKNVMVTRKGAVSAKKDELAIIPGSMGAKSFIVRGKGNPHSLMSCSHGAGRIMSRKAAKKAFTIDDHINSTNGVECIKDESVLDETPKAYKDIELVMAAQTDNVEIVHTLKQVLCVKGTSNDKH